MRTVAKMRELAQVLCKKGADQEVIEAVISVLETDKNFERMIKEMNNLKNPSRECMIGKAILIAEPD